jgi:hypothetical protein
MTEEPDSSDLAPDRPGGLEVYHGPGIVTSSEDSTSGDQYQGNPVTGAKPVHLFPYDPLTDAEFIQKQLGLERRPHLDEAYLDNWQLDYIRFESVGVVQSNGLVT